jgi:signal peptidase I
MEDTIQNRNLLLSDRLTYHITGLKRFDVIQFYPDDNNKIYIKRIIGLPGEHVQITDDGSIYINGELLEEDYGKDQIEDPGIAGGDGITLADDEYFCLGDNRNVSLDSRFIGPIKKSSICGHAYMRIFPFTEFGLLE